MILYLILLLMIIETFLKSKKYLHMLQQNLYNENNRYLKWIFKNNYLFFNLEIIAIVLIIIGSFVIYDIKKYSLIVEILIAVIYFLMCINWKNILEKDKIKEKKPLVITNRIKRLLVTITIINLIPIILFLFNNSWIYILIYAIMLYLNGIVIFICNLINIPVEKIVYNHFKNMAQNKLNNMPDLKIIGITGSYGKTSSKNILADILNIKYNALPTPKNLNTFNGLIMTVNNNMDKWTDIFIAEMGAYVKGEIKKLCDLVHPKYGILTRIGTAHLESFGSEDNIRDGKFELIESLPSDGIGILNKDDIKQVEYNLKNDVEIVWIGIDNQDVDVRAVDIKCSKEGTNFKIKFKDDKKLYPFKTKLLGVHNVYNILAGVALGKKLGIDIEDLENAVKNVKPIEHRLELKKIGKFYMIDDAYNSNPVGAKNAVDVLKMMPGIKIVVTPGMIELADKEDEYNMKFGEQIAEVADYVVLIGREKTKSIYRGLVNKGYNIENVIVYNDVREAYNFINTIANGNNEVYALFENDLPDSYNE